MLLPTRQKGSILSWANVPECTRISRVPKSRDAKGVDRDGARLRESNRSQESGGGLAERTDFGWLPEKPEIDPCIGSAHAVVE